MLAGLLASGGASAASSTLDLTASNAVNGTINVPQTSGTVAVTSNNTDSVTLWVPSYWGDPVVVNSDGSVTLSETHATGQVVTIAQAPALYYSDGVGVSLPSLTPIVPTTGGGGGGGGGGTGSGGGGSTTPDFAVVAPTLPQPSGTQDIVAVELRNPGKTALPGGVVTFGQAFVKGDVPQGTTLSATSAAGAVPVQMDVKALDSDQSVRHAVISLMAPPMAPGTAVDIMLSRGTTPVTGTALAPADILASGYDVRLELSFTAGSTAPAVTISSAAALKEAIAKGTVQAWLQNPLVSEYRVIKAINAHQQAIFDIRAAAGGPIMTDVIVANNLGYVAPQTYTYNVRIVDHGKLLWKAANITQTKFQTWHQVVWNTAVTLPSVAFDVPYLVESGAVPPFDLSLGVSNATINTYVAAVKAAASGPLGKALVTPYMPETGGRDDIGPVPNWTANYLVSQDPRAMGVMLANADAAGSVPWHVRELDGTLVTSLKHPQLWLDDRCTGSDCLPGGFDGVGGATGWTLDTAHEPDLAYVPYLVTGSHYYLDQVQDEANWEMLAGNPGYRGGTKSLVYPNDQIRGVAWNIRDISNAGWITPNVDPNQHYFYQRAEWNMADIVKLQVVEHQGPAVGELTGFLYDGYHPQSISPWQQDFLVLSLSQQNKRHFAYAKKFLEYMVNFVAGRFLNGADGFNPLHATAYWPNYVNPTTNQPVTTWRAFYQLNFAGQPAPTVLDGYPTNNLGYAAVARASTADLFTATASLDALRAYSYLVSQTPGIFPSFQQGAFYDVNPIMPDGHVLQNVEIQYGQTSGTLVADHPHNLLVGGSGQTTLQGAAGVSILYAGNGPTTLIAEPGINYLFGGPKTTTIHGSSGQNFYSIGTGTTQIVVNAGVAATDTVEHIKPGVDHVHITGLGGTVQSLLSSARPAAAGGTSVTIGTRHTITFPDLAPPGITAALFN